MSARAIVERGRGAWFLALALMLLAFVGCSQTGGAPTRSEPVGRSAQALGGATITTDLSTYPSGATINVTYAGLPGNDDDWIDIAPTGSTVMSVTAQVFTGGQVNGTTTFTAPGNGSWVVRAFSNDTYTLLAESTPFTVTGGPSPSITTNPTYIPGASVIVSYGGLPGNPTDYIALAVAGSSDSTYLSYVFTNGQQSGTATLTAPGVGSYVARAYSDNTTNVVVESTAFAVSGGPGATIGTDSSSYTPGATVMVPYTGLPGNDDDWIAIAPAGSPDTTYLAYVFTGGQINGTASFTAPGVGSYVARAFSNNTYTLLAESTPFTVAGGPSPAISTNSPSYASGAPIVVTYSGMPGNYTDWIDIAPAGSTDQSVTQQVYTQGQLSGTVTFTAPGNGSWVARSFSNGTYTLLAESTPFTVTGGPSLAISTDASSYVGGAAVIVAYAGLPGNPTDYIALAPAGSGGASYLSYVFTNGQQSGTATLTAPTSSGSYVARAYSNNTTTVLVESTPFTVLAPPATVSAGFDHTCSLLTDGTVACWGNNGDGELGNGTTTNSSSPLLVPNLTGVTAVASGGYHTCALVTGGMVECWGAGQFGALGNGTTTDSLIPVPVSNLSGVSAIAAGFESTCALLTGGTVECWGSSGDGELGNGNSTGPNTCVGSPCSTTPVAVSNLTGVTAIAIGYYNACALTGGTVECWGFNVDGELGNGSATGPETCNGLISGEACSTIPVAVTGLTGVVTALSAGSDSVCALISGGTINCWGWDGDGELGDGNGATTNDSPTPVLVANINNAMAIGSGDFHSCAVLTDGTAQCWGFNGDGELGIGTTTGPDPDPGLGFCSFSPVAVLNLTGATAITGGSSDTCALAGSTVECWGNNMNGELGNGTTTNSSTPVVVPAL
jgi:alpha-tubulin suppressor-like RCC1 family protein